MKIKISQQILKNYPQTKIGYLIVNVSVQKSDLYTEELKGELVQDLAKQGITKDNYASHPNISKWREVFQEMGVSHKTHCSSVEALVKRIVVGKKMWSISNIVDLYNCCSVLSLTPIGDYNLSSIKGDIIIRYGKENDKFEPLGSNDPILVEPQQIVYADEEKVICWLWNYRDSKNSVINENTKQIIFFLDSVFELNHWKMEQIINFLWENLTKLGVKTREFGILNQENSEIGLKNFRSL